MPETLHMVADRVIAGLEESRRFASDPDDPFGVGWYGWIDPHDVYLLAVAALAVGESEN